MLPAWPEKPPVILRFLSDRGQILSAARQLVGTRHRQPREYGVVLGFWSRTHFRDSGCRNVVSNQARRAGVAVCRRGPSQPAAPCRWRAPYNPTPILNGLWLFVHPIYVRSQDILGTDLLGPRTGMSIQYVLASPPLEYQLADCEDRDATKSLPRGVGRS